MHRAVLTQEHEFHMVNGKLFITSETDPDKQVALSVKERVGNIRLVETGIHITKKAQWMIGRPNNVGCASQAHRAKRRSRQDLNLRPTDPQSVALSTELRDHMTVFVIESIPVHATCVKYSRAKIFWGLLWSTAQRGALYRAILIDKLPPTSRIQRASLSCLTTCFANAQNELVVYNVLVNEAVDHFLRTSQGFAADVVVGPEALLAAIYQACVTQNAEVMRNSGLFQREALHDLKDAYFAFMPTEET